MPLPLEHFVLEDGQRVGIREAALRKYQGWTLIALSDNEFYPLITLEWGGWEDLETSLDHY